MNKITRKAVDQKLQEGKQLTPSEIDLLITQSSDIWRNRKIKEKKKGIPRKPGEVRAFVHDF